MTKPKKIVPFFANETDEREFWEHTDSTEYVDWNKAKQVVFSDLIASLAGRSRPCRRF